MASTAQIAVNRRNSAASSGHKSAKGKARSNRNAEKLGFTRALTRRAWLQDQSTKSTAADSPLQK